MTDEQIKQNADAYAMRVAESHVLERRPFYVAAFNGFMSGAHSLDEEIEQFKEWYHDKILTLAHEIEQLRNPWISVKEQPKKSDVYYVRTQQGCADMAYFDSSIEKWEKGRFTDGTVTHWMPIPQIEKGELK